MKLLLTTLLLMGIMLAGCSRNTTPPPAKEINYGSVKITTEPIGQQCHWDERFHGRVRHFLLVENRLADMSDSRKKQANVWDRNTRVHCVDIIETED